MTAGAGGPGVAPAPEDVAAGPRWRRFHPATPLVKSWVAVLVALGIVADGVVGGVGIPGPGPQDFGPQFGLSTQLLGVLGIAVVALVANVLGWWFTAYRVDEGALQLRSGVLSRSFRQAPLDRIQAVDVVQPIVGRLFGLAELRVEVAGGSESDVKLAYLPERRAQQLRNSLLAEAAGMSPGGGEEVPEAPETPVLAVPVDRLVASILLSALPAAAAVLLGMAVLVAAEIPFAALAGVLPALLGLGGYLFSRFARGFNFRLATGDDGIRVRSGLTETRAATIPPGRVQALEFAQPLLWRRWDWWRVQVNIAGYGAGEDSQQRTVLLPVGTRLDALWVLRLVVPDIGTDRPLDVLAAALAGTGAGDGFVHSPRRARWLDPLTWRRNGYAVTGTVVLVRTGRLRRRLVVVPHARIQSLGLTQGPLTRRLHLADVGLHSTPGPVTPVVAHLEAAEAVRLVAEQAVRARRAREHDRSERWMSPLDTAPDPGPGAS
ncbi:MAG: PH domain-containing protein [Kineosporiaceae bacterium]